MRTWRGGYRRRRRKPHTSPSPSHRPVSAGCKRMGTQLRDGHGHLRRMSSGRTAGSFCTARGLWWAWQSPFPDWWVCIGLGGCHRRGRSTASGGICGQLCDAALTYAWRLTIPLPFVSLGEAAIVGCNPLNGLACRIAVGDDRFEFGPVAFVVGQVLAVGDDCRGSLSS